MTPRLPKAEELSATARLWYDAWHETQAPFVPEDLIAQRTLSSFEIRLSRMGDLLRVVGPVGTPLGLCAIKPAELDQLYVAPQARRGGLAAILMADAEQRLMAQGNKAATLICLSENEPAIRFYTRQGWVNTGIHPAQLETLAAPVTIPCIIFQKDLSAHAAS